MSKRHLKRTLLTLLSSAGYGLLLPSLNRNRRDAGRRELRILTYHSVSSLRIHETSISPEAFDAQLAFLADHAQVVDLQTVVSGRLDELSGSKPVVALTFDDGYADNLHVAVPILAKYGFPATFYVLADYVGTDRYLAHDAGDAHEAVRLLSWDEVRELDHRGFAIGSHGRSHVRMSSLGDEELRAEIGDSKARIEAA